MPDHSNDVVWRIHLKARAEEVFALIATDQGRAAFWAERSMQQGEEIVFLFPGGVELVSRILESCPPERYSLTYFGGSIVTFELTEHDDGTDLLLRETGIPESEVEENRAGWVSVLLNLKAMADHGVDLRNHHPQRTWVEGFVDN